MDPDGFLIESWGSLGASYPPLPLSFSFSIIQFSLLSSPLQTAVLPLVGEMLTYIPMVLTHQCSSSCGENFFIQGPLHQSQQRTVTGSAWANLHGQGNSNGSNCGHFRVCDQVEEWWLGTVKHRAT